MTKEIIIDGVNVAECEFHSMINTIYKKGYCEGYKVSCSINKNCYFKQLAREKQKNEELEKEKQKYLPYYELGAKCTELKEVADYMCKKNDKLLEENKKLKKELEIRKM